MGIPEHHSLPPKSRRHSCGRRIRILGLPFLLPSYKYYRICFLQNVEDTQDDTLSPRDNWPEGFKNCPLSRLFLEISVYLVGCDGYFDFPITSPIYRNASNSIFLLQQLSRKSCARGTLNFKTFRRVQFGSKSRNSLRIR